MNYSDRLGDVTWKMEYTYRNYPEHPVKLAPKNNVIIY